MKKLILIACLFAPACKSEKVLTPAAQAAVASIERQIDEETDPTKRNALIDERNRVLYEGVKETSGSLIDLITGAIPLPKPLSEVLLATGIPLLFPRPRKHALQLVKNSATMKPIEAIKSLGAMYGLVSTESTNLNVKSV